MHAFLLEQSGTVEIISSWDAVRKEHLSNSNKVKDARVHLSVD